MKTTEQIMSLADTWRLATSDYSYSKTALQAAIEQLVQERDALKYKLDSSVHGQNQPFDLCKLLEAERDALSKLADKWNFECDELREDNKRLAAEVKTLRDGLQVYQTQLEKDTNESDLHALMRQGVEIAELKAENKTLRDALEGIVPFIPVTSASEGGAAKHSANVRAADAVRAALKGANHEPN